MLSFNDFLEKKEFYLEVHINRGSIPLDSEELDYLKQFPENRYAQALLLRYNVALKDAVQLRGRDVVIKDNWQDVQDIVLGSRSIKVKFNINRLIKKLKALGFDIIHMKPLNKKTVYQNISRWRKTGFSPEYKAFQPYKMYKQQNNYNGVFDAIEGGLQWGQIARRVREIVTDMCNAYVKRMALPEHPLHMNYYYWSEHLPELIGGTIDYIKDNLKDIQEDRDIKKFATNYIGSRMQQGSVSRKMYQKAKTLGLQPDIVSSLIKGSTRPKAILNLINRMVGRDPADPTTLGI